jgi:SsrA-binding protein
MKPLAINKRALFDYNILEKFEAGLVLKGYEVKSIKNGHISLKGAFVTFRRSELYLTNATISPYKQAGDIKNYNPTAPRKLLVKKSEIKKLLGKVRSEGLTLVPISVYNKKSLIKLEFALGKGKKKVDKRRTIQDREDKIKIERAYKERR